MGTITPTLKIVGFEVRRSDSSFISRQVQTEIFKIVLNGGKKQEILDFVKNVKEQIMNGNFNYDQIGIPKGLSKQVDEYTKQVPPQVKGIKYTEQYLKIKFPPRSKVKFIYVESMPLPYPPTDVVSFERKEQLPQGIKINWKRQMPVLIDNQVQRIFEALGMEGIQTDLGEWY